MIGVKMKHEGYEAAISAGVFYAVVPLSHPTAVGAVLRVYDGRYGARYTDFRVTHVSEGHSPTAKCEVIQ